MNSKKFNRIFISIDFLLVAFNIYWGSSHDNPVSLVAAVFCLISGIILIWKEED